MLGSLAIGSITPIHELTRTIEETTTAYKEDTNIIREESWITILHEMDDEEVNTLRRDEYHTPVHYDAYYQDAGEDSDECNPYFFDEKTDPLRLILQEIEDDEHEDQIIHLIKAMKDLKPGQQDLIEKKFFMQKTNVEIATEDAMADWIFPVPEISRPLCWCFRHEMKMKNISCCHSCGCRRIRFPRESGMRPFPMTNG